MTLLVWVVSDVVPFCIGLFDLDMLPVEAMSGG
jgi:hypothetical protein